jgi:hypothetical protein
MKTLNPNIETLNKSQIPKSQIPNFRSWGCLEHWSLLFGTCLEFRISDLEFARAGVQR